jgi:Flp pilus assembly protein CpaB
MNDTPNASKDGFATGLGLGLAVGFALLCLGTAGMFFFFKKQGLDAKKGWNLVPVIVATVDITENTAVTMEMISQRSVPEQFVTSSIVKPDSASYIVNQKVLVPVQAGDPLRWSDFETTKKTKVLYAARDVALGAALTSDDFEERGVDEGLLTESFVRVSDQPNALGRTTIAPFRKGDPILWTHLPPKAAK